MKKRFSLKILLSLFAITTTGVIMNKFGNSFSNSPESFDTGVSGYDHMWYNKARILEINSFTIITVEILSDKFTAKRQLDHSGKVIREDDYHVVEGDVVEVIFDENNDRAIGFIRELKVGSIVNISRPSTTKVDFDKTPLTIKCTGLSVYDSSGEIIIKDF